MAVESNASTKAQKKLLEEVAATIEDPEFTDVNLTFGKGQSVTLVIDGDEQEFPSYSALRTHLKESTGDVEEGDSEEDESENPRTLSDWADATRVQLGQLNVDGLDVEGVTNKGLKGLFEEGATPSEAAEQVAKAFEAEQARVQAAKAKEAEQKQAIEEASKQLDSEVAALTKVIRGERSGELQKNEARYAKGERLANLEDIANRLKAAGDKRFKSNRAVLAFAREKVQESIADQGVIDTGLAQRLSDQEVSASRTVYRTYMHNGMNTTFRLVDTIDPTTGQPYQDDAGNPPEMPITGIAMNKLYILAKVYNPEDHDQIISFAHRTGEKALTAARKLMNPEEDNAAEVIKEIQEYLDSDPVKDDGEPFKSADEAIIDLVAKRTGKTAPSQVKSIKVDAGWYESFWRPAKEIATALSKSQGWPLDEKGEVSNTVLLERIIALALPDFTNGPEDAVNEILNVFMNSDELTEEQATQFFDQYLSELNSEEGEGEEDEEAEGEEQGGAISA